MPIEVTAGDSTVLRGELRSGGEDWVLLVHDQGADLDGWGDLPGLVAAQGFTVLALDLRGHGASDGEPAPETMVSDLIAVIGFAVGNEARRVFVGSAGRAAAAALEIAAEPTIPLSGLFLLSPAISTATRPATVPKLLLVGTGEAAADEVFAVAVGPWTIARLPASQRGLDLLHGTWGGRVRELILGFLGEHRRGAPVPMRPRRAGPTQEMRR